MAHGSVFLNRGRRRLEFLLVAAAVAVLVVAWKKLSFLTDDAFIAFRYVSNRQLGFGYVWNAPPFLPVEGYTSFLWVVLLDLVWSLTGVEPPQSCNWLGLAFGIGTLLLGATMVQRLALDDRLRPWRTWFLFVVLLGTVTNFSFVAWTSSGLETSLFNFLFVAWIASVLFVRPGSPRWVAGVTASAGLLALCRPDGLLAVAATVALLAWVMWSGRLGRSRATALAASPLLLPAAHVLWRRSFYGEWLPNTYYAKLVGAWPEAGVRYLASFLLEYGLWWWVLLALAALVPALRQLVSPRRLFDRARSEPSLMARLAVTCTVLAHVGYYALRVGGDHFEYRIYSYTVVPVLVGAVWLVDRLVRGCPALRWPAIMAPLVVVLLSWPIPWTIWAVSQECDTRATTLNLVIPVAELFPPGTGWYLRPFDDLQTWLIRKHAIGKRVREHQVFELIRAARFRQRELGAEWHDERRVSVDRHVGVSGWILARAYVIDRKGLSDWVIARTPVPEDSGRRMAHDREAPQGYVNCFAPNISNPRIRLLSVGKLADYDPRDLIVSQRKTPLTDEDIVACERKWRAWIRERQ